MRIVSKRITVKSRSELDIVDITDDVEELVEASKVIDGIATIFVAGSTGALTTIEYEPGLLVDFRAMLQRIAPNNIHYEHEKRWHDGNGHSHVRASLLGPSITIPIADSQLALGRWQQLVFVELDARARSRELVVQILGEKKREMHGQDTSDPNDHGRYTG